MSNTWVVHTMLPSSRQVINVKARLYMIAGAVITLLVIASLTGLYFLVRSPIDFATTLAHDIGHDFREAFNFTPRVTIGETVVIEQTIPILELATIKRDLFTEYTWSHTWLGSTKTLTLRGIHTAKAGFDLHDRFGITIQREPLTVTATVPDAKLLSLEMKDYKVMRDEDGWWNKITAEDRQYAVQALQRVAREKAVSSGLLQEAKSSMEEQIRHIIEKNQNPPMFKEKK